ncbi:hypothetical protein XI02_13830 [Bradyrhizobium sp. CCBAU 21365]|nr:hypothetical protein XI02_13830 [Bradyrhizobium sp. CCBAU 21365]
MNSLADDTPDDSGKDSDVAHWLTEIERAQNTTAMKRWEERCRKIRDKYRYEASATVKKRGYQMLWSNMETMKPAVMSKPPKGAVQQRWKDRDPVASKATEMLQRAINFTFEANDYMSKFLQVRDDYLLYARGIARVKYSPVFDTVTQEAGQPDDAAIDPANDLAEQAKEAYASPQTILKSENVVLEYYQRGDFVHSISRTWDEVEWEAFRGYLGRDQLINRFGKEIGGAIPLDATSDESDKGKNNPSLPTSKATIWEIWDKVRNEVLWVAKGYPKVLERGPPYLKFDGFFPNPKPAYGTLTNDSLEPVPDFIFYKDQADEVDMLTARIASLQQSLKFVGFYPAGPEGEGQPAVERAMQPGFENKLIAVKSWAAFVDGGKNGAPITYLPIDQVANILKGCVDLRKQLIEDIYQIYGLSDIMRGDGDASETATAQSIKAQYGSVRIKTRQDEMARFARDVTGLVGEVISTCFAPETIMQMANMPLPSQAELDAAALEQQRQALIARALAPQPPQIAGPGAPAMLPPPAPQSMGAVT